MSAQCAVGTAEMKRSPVVRGARGGNSARGARANPYRNKQCDRSKGAVRRLRLRNANRKKRAFSPKTKNPEAQENQGH